MKDLIWCAKIGTDSKRQFRNIIVQKTNLNLLILNKEERLSRLKKLQKLNSAILFENYFVCLKNLKNFISKF